MLASVGDRRPAPLFDYLGAKEVFDHIAGYPDYRHAISDFVIPSTRS
jgi:hypothetical protein